jgi:hypothetical protein
MDAAHSITYLRRFIMPALSIDDLLSTPGQIDRTRPYGEMKAEFMPGSTDSQFLREAARQADQLGFNSGFDDISSIRIRPNLFFIPEYNADGEMRRHVFASKQLVHVVVQRSVYGNVSDSTNIVGMITDVYESSIVVRILAGRPSNGRAPIYNGRASAVHVGRLVTVSKSSATRLDPTKLSVNWYLHANVVYSSERLRQARETHQERMRRSPLYLDPRHIFRFGEYYDWGNFASYRAALGRGGFIRSVIDAAVRKHGVGVLNSKDTLLAICGKRARKALRDIPMSALGSYIESQVGAINNRADVDGDNFIMRGDAFDCRHYFRRADAVEINGYQHICPRCREIERDHIVEAINQSGNTVLIFRGNEQVWDDGTVRTYSQPALIGQYHSSARLVGPLRELPDRNYADSGLTLGFELEMEAASGHIDSETERTRLAKNVNFRMVNAHQQLGVPLAAGAQKYAFFERDGSIDQGFEMVTSYGSLETHQHFVKRIFGIQEGETALPFKGLLRSHDASASCGLHVHMKKPTTLAHAVKLQAFYSDPNNKELVRCVARRYNVRYTEVPVGKDAIHAAHNTLRAVRSIGRLKGRNAAVRKEVVRDAITALSEGNRYQAVNFLPANTVEIRIFKGSMLPTTILACLEFAHASWFFARDSKASELSSDAFLRFIAQQDRRHETQNLRVYLAARGYKLYVPKIAPNAAPTAHEFNAVDA